MAPPTVVDFSSWKRPNIRRKRRDVELAMAIAGDRPIQLRSRKDKRSSVGGNNTPTSQPPAPRTVRTSSEYASTSSSCSSHEVEGSQADRISIKNLLS
ncbi:hypothetical protein PROFUN_01139 [Planoprotostelium fungivorum]|uniref:Uncharacterized protein n=1 Tax=Planoprotostelium fungivorum TaxID=1890364 RepID=A0A2P6NCH7_9EUKA|nr:hypothetical protein PROFUN_01139 [Planoprotostelium fungivorum]